MSRVKIFDKNVFLEDLRQLKTIGVVCGVILLLESVLVPLYVFIISDNFVDESYSSADIVPLYAMGPLIMCITLLMPIMTNLLFDFIDKRNSSDFYHSLPVRRETMYITHILAMLITCLALFVIPSAVEYVLFLPMSYFKVTLEGFGYVFADVMVLGLLFSSAVILAKCLCGTRFGVMAVFLMILVLPRCYLIFIKTCIEGYFPYVLLGENHSIFWDQSWNLLFGAFSDYKSVRSIIYTLVLSLIYFALGGVLFVKRRSEKAESVAVNKHIQLIFRTLPALTFSFLPILVLLECVHEDGLTSDSCAGIFILYVVAVVIYFLYELLTTRKLNSVVKAAPGLILLLAGNLLIYGVIEGYGNYQLGIKPSADEITSVQFMVDSDSYISRTGVILTSNGYYCDEVLQDIAFTDDEVVSLISYDLANTASVVESGDYYWCNDICVKIKYNGGTIYRRLYIENENFGELLNTVLASDDFFTVVDLLPDFSGANDTYSYAKLNYSSGYSTSSVDLGDADFGVIYESYKEELGALDKLEQYNLAVYGESDGAYMSFTFQSDRYEKSYSIQLYVDEELTPKTWELVRQYLNITSYYEIL